MKKKYFLFTVIFTLLMSVNVFASGTVTTPSNYYDWADWRDNTYLNSQDPFFSYNVNGSSFNIGYYMGYFQEPGKACIVKYRNGNQVTYIVFSTTSFNLKTFNGASSEIGTINSSLYDGINLPGAMHGFNDYFSSASGHLYYATSNIVDSSWGTVFDDHYDFSVISGQDLAEQLSALNWRNPESNDSGDLPFIGFTLQRFLVPQLSLNITTTKLKFLWEYQKLSPYKDNPSNYTFDIIAWANYKQAPTGIGEIFDVDNFNINGVNKVVISNGGYNISVNEYSFLYDDIGSKVWGLSGKTWKGQDPMTLGYMLGIRTRSNDSSQASYYKVFIVQAGGMVRSTGMVIQGDGTVKRSEADNSNDGMTGNNEDNGGYSGDNSNSAESDPSGQVYDETGQFNLATVMNEFKSIINTLGALPAIMWQVLSFLPSWFITLFAVSFGLIIAIGIVKTVLN